MTTHAAIINRFIRQSTAFTVAPLCPRCELQHFGTTGCLRRR